MQRNNNHIIVIGIVLILLMLTYNTAMSSGGAQESTGIWAWLNASNNAGAVQAIGNILQVIAAVLTFGAMVYLGYKQYNLSKQQNCLVEEQKEMTRRQINLSLYEKRYKIRDKCIGSLVNLINVSLPTDYVEYKRVYTQEKAIENVNIIAKNNLLSNPENDFLLPEEMLKKLKEVLHIQGQLQTLQKELDDDFKDMLDFRKI